MWCTRQVWFADDATGAGSFGNLKRWWAVLSSSGPDFGYYPNASKTYLVVKDGLEEQAKSIFAETNMIITSAGKRHLGAAIGARAFTEDYVLKKVQNWVEEIEFLAHIADSYPQEALYAYNHGMKNKWSFIMRTIQGISALFHPLETAIHRHLIPAITGRPPCSSEERELCHSQSDLEDLVLTTQ